jgi:excisionase family DNA binding protein
MSDTRGPSLLLTVDEVALLLQISKSKAKKLIAAGDIRSVLVGRLRRVRATDLDAYVEALTAGGDHGPARTETAAPDAV